MCLAVHETSVRSGHSEPISGTSMLGITNKVDSICVTAMYRPKYTRQKRNEMSLSGLHCGSESTLLISSWAMDVFLCEVCKFPIQSRIKAESSRVLVDRQLQGSNDCLKALSNQWQKRQ